MKLGGQKLHYNLGLVLVYGLVLSNLVTQADAAVANATDIEAVAMKKNQRKPDSIYDVLKVKEMVKTEFKEIWKQSWRIYNMGSNVTHSAMTEYWQSLLIAFNRINDVVKYYDRKINRAQPSTLMNLLFVSPDMEFLDTLSTTPTQNDSIHWHVRFLEISSLATQVNWFYNKRIYDILHVNKYLKSVAESITTLYGYPWLAEISVKKGGNITNRLQMKAFNRLTHMLIARETHGNIFYGIRKLIDKSANVLTSAAVDANSCTGKPYGEIVPIRLDAPIYVCMYLGLFHVKMFVLRSLSFIYDLVYNAQVTPDAEVLTKARLDDDVDLTLNLFNKSFHDYQTTYGFKLVPVMRGYFMCDQQELKAEDYIQITNFQNVFLIPQLMLDPTEKCDIPCGKIGTGKLPVDCDKPKNDKEKQFCTNVACPLDQITCSGHSNPRAIACPSKNPNQLYDWYELGFKHFGPRAKCGSKVLGFTGTAVNQTKTYGGPTTKMKGRLAVSVRGEKPINDEHAAEVESCDVCRCQCNDPVQIHGSKRSVRTFSLVPSLAKVEENRVVVGAKFEQIGDVIHLVIADAVLQPSFYVDMATVVWRNATNPGPKGEGETVTLGQDLKSMYLHSGKVSPDYVITGVRFLHSAVTNKDTGESTKYIGIEVQQMKIDAMEGKLVKNESEWIQKGSNFTGNMLYAGYGEPDNPLKMDGISLPDSSAEQLIAFRPTSLKKHGGQLIIPFLDAQPVIFPNKTYALKGIGIYHRHKIGFGGLIGIKVLPYEDKHLR